MGGKRTTRRYTHQPVLVNHTNLHIGWWATLEFSDKKKFRETLERLHYLVLGIHYELGSVGGLLPFVCPVAGESAQSRNLNAGAVKSDSNARDLYLWGVAEYPPKGC